MTRRRLLLDAMLGIVRRDARLYFSYRNRVIAQVLIVAANVTLFYYVSRLVGSERFSDPEAYFAFVVVGLQILHVLTATLSMLPLAVRQELLAGTFERLAVSPLGPAASIVAMTAFPLLSALVTGVVTLTVAGTVFGLSLAWSTAWLSIPAALLAALAFLPFALLIGSAVLVFKQAGAAGSFLVIGLSLASGVYFPTDVLPGWIRWIAQVQPFGPALELLRYLLIGTDINASGSVGSALLRLALFAVVMLPVSLIVLDASVRRCRRLGTLIEY